MTQLEITIREIALRKMAGFNPKGPIRAEMEDMFSEYIKNFTDGALWMLEELNRTGALNPEHFKKK